MSGNISGNDSLQIINAITQFVDGTQAAWNSVTVPLPAGLVVYATDTTAVKMGDGSTLYENLPTLFLLSSLTSLTASINALTQDNTTNVASIGTLNTEYAALEASITALQTAIAGISTNSNNAAIATLTSEYNTLTTDYNTVQSAVNALQTALTNLTSTVNPIPNEITTITSNYNTLQSLVTTLQASINSLSTTVDPIPAEITTIQSNVTSLQNSVATINTTLTPLPGEVAANTTAISLLNSEYTAQQSTITPLQSFLNGQLNNKLSLRSLGIVYTNTQNKPIMVIVETVSAAQASGQLMAYVSGNQIAQQSSTSYSNTAESLTFIVPIGATYEVSGSNMNLTYWNEFF